MESENNLVWYAVYGSKLSSGRIIHYIQGGTPSGSTKACEPCNDTSLPQKEQLPPCNFYINDYSEVNVEKILELLQG